MATSTMAQRTAANIRKEMESKKVGQIALADLVGMSQSALSRRLLGQVPFDISEIEQIASALRVPIQRLIAA